ncbi:MAG: NTP transferase domain-containing protein [Planctomycetota bacterium]
MSELPVEKTVAVILAAGKGVRMESDLPKVLHPLAGRPLVNWVSGAVAKAGVSRIIAVTGYGADQVEAALQDGVESVRQETQLGTGHALLCARDSIRRTTPDYLFVLCGDAPLIRASTLRALLGSLVADDASAVILTFNADNGHRYGRIVRDADGGVLRIVEHKDATPDELTIREANSGTYAFKADVALDLLDSLKNDNKQGEYYLTDLIELMIASGHRVSATLTESVLEASGVNTPDQLQRLEKALLSEPKE